MPVTLVIADHPSRTWERTKVASNSALFSQSCEASFSESRKIIQSSVSRRDFRRKHISPSNNGLVLSAFHAYSGHHHLVLRPEDVWFAILSQLSFYVNAHAEELRDYFVSHQGRKELVIEDNTSDFGALARRMAELIQQNVKEPRLQEWIMPSFSTTTDCDRTVAAILMMGSMQRYFGYKICQDCGIPSVTLLGDRKDWENILARIDYLCELGPEPSVFAKLLRPVLQNFVASFDGQMSASLRQFWGKIAHQNYMDSGPSYLSGWITAFCFWNETGESLYGTEDYPRRPGCELDGVRYHQVETDEIPAGFASVPVTVECRGDVCQTKMVAGSIGIEAKHSGALEGNGSAHPHGEHNTSPESNQRTAVEPKINELAANSALDTLQPLSGWFMYELGTACPTGDTTGRYCCYVL